MHLPILENESISVHYILPDTYFSNVETQKGVRQRGSERTAGREAPGAWPVCPHVPCRLRGGGHHQMPPSVAPGLWVTHHVRSRWHWARPGPPAGLSSSPLPPPTRQLSSLLPAPALRSW